MRLLKIAALLVFAVLTSAPAQAGIFCHRRAGARGECGTARTRFSVRVRGVAPAGYVPTVGVGGCGVGGYGVTPSAGVIYRAPAPPRGGGYAPDGFLSSLNAWRARNGRGPLAWDNGLASYAACNTGVHAPGSSGGGAQCWAGVQSLDAALPMWESSPAHAAILLTGTTVGASTCPSGATCNVR